MIAVKEAFRVKLEKQYKNLTECGLIFDTTNKNGTKTFKFIEAQIESLDMLITELCEYVSPMRLFNVCRTLEKVNENDPTLDTTEDFLIVFDFETINGGRIKWKKHF